MSEERRTWRVVAVATVLCALGVLVLGTRWEGIEITAGQWRDTISLARWGVFWAAASVLGLATGGSVRSWTNRGLASVPLLLWFAVELRSGTLGPLAWLIYAAPTLATWLGGGLLNDLIRRRWHAP